MLFRSSFGLTSLLTTFAAYSLRSRLRSYFLAAFGATVMLRGCDIKKEYSGILATLVAAVSVTIYVLLLTTFAASLLEI